MIACDYFVPHIHWTQESPGRLLLFPNSGLLFLTHLLISYFHLFCSNDASKVELN
jgi:hypothetical protein